MKNNNSKVVKLCRIIPFSQESNQDLSEFFGQAVRGVGSFFPRGSKKAGSGLTFDQEKLLMPFLINLQPEDRDFRKELDLFFVEITTKVPHEGLPLEVGLLDNSKPLGDPLDKEIDGYKVNMPISVEDYVKWKHAIAHPHTALSKEEAEGNQLKMFYILDEKKTAIVKKDENDIKDDAQGQYLLIKKHADKVDMILTNLGIDTRDVDTDKAVLLLKEYISKDDVSYSRSFLNIIKDNKLDSKYRIKKLIQTGILKNVGNAILITETSAKIGNDLEQAVVWWEDASNSSIVGTLKARYQEFNKKRKITIPELSEKTDNSSEGSED